MKNIHIALDLDKTTAFYESKWRAKKIGPILEPMKQNILRWLAKGYKVTIFTARVEGLESKWAEDHDEAVAQREMILQFLQDNGLPQLYITATKLKSFTHFVDDKAWHVEPNTGLIDNCPAELS
jgi:hypothetical protein